MLTHNLCKEMMILFHKTKKNPKYIKYQAEALEGSEVKDDETGSDEGNHEKTRGWPYRPF